MKIIYLNKISEFAHNYDYFIIDLWGVLHDGVSPYPGTVESLGLLRKQNKKIILLSNAPRRAFKTEQTMERLGFPREFYDHVLTSGEVGYRWLEGDGKKMGNRFYYIGPKRDEDILDGLDYVKVSDPKDADFVIVTGFDEFGDAFETKKPEVDKCLEAGLPMVCMNPDRIVVRQTGEVMLCAGLIAEFYEKNGGTVYYFGKPYIAAYNYCLQIFGTNDPSKIAAIGDGLHTDIEGANHLGAYSVLIPGGVLGEALGVKHGELPTQEKMMEICAKEKTFPKAVMPAFVW